MYLYVPKACECFGIWPCVWLGRPSGCVLCVLLDNTGIFGQSVPRVIVLPQLRAVVAEALVTRSVPMNTAQLAGVASRETSGSAKQSPQEFPQCPGEDLHAHAATQFVEAVEARWAARGLLVVADGGKPAAAKAIVDVDLAQIPALAPGSRDFHRREEARIKVMAQNASNAQKRIQIELDAWTELYTDLKVSIRCPPSSRHRCFRAS